MGEIFAWRYMSAYWDPGLKRSHTYLKSYTIITSSRVADFSKSFSILYNLAKFRWIFRNLTRCAEISRHGQRWSKWEPLNFSNYISLFNIFCGGLASFNRELGVLRSALTIIGELLIKLLGLLAYVGIHFLPSSSKLPKYRAWGLWSGSGVLVLGLESGSWSCSGSWVWVQLQSMAELFPSITTIFSQCQCRGTSFEFQSHSRQ